MRSWLRSCCPAYRGCMLSLGAGKKNLKKKLERNDVPKEQRQNAGGSRSAKNKTLTSEGEKKKKKRERRATARVRGSFREQNSISPPAVLNPFSFLLSFFQRAVARGNGGKTGERAQTVPKNKTTKRSRKSIAPGAHSKHTGA